MIHKECGWCFKLKVQRRGKGKSTVTSLCGSESFVVGSGPGTGAYPMNTSASRQNADGF